MNQFICVMVTVLYCLGVTEKGQGAFVSQTESKMDESTCTLAEPDITCNYDGSCVVEHGLEFLENTNVSDNGVWIGFSKTWISYTYVGCNQVNVGVEYSVSTLGECRRTSGCQTFGIRNSTEGLRCKCAGNSQVYYGTCMRKCEEADQYPCGDTTDTTLFSIYTVENVPPSSNSQDKRNCLLFYYGYGGEKGHDFYWNSCRLKNYPTLLCSDSNFSDPNQMAQTNPISFSKWATAVDYCFVRKHFPATIQSIINVQFSYKNSRDYWTGIIKTESIISLSSMLDNSINPPITYAYVQVINQTFNVRFANEGESRKSLCAGDGTSRIPAISTGEPQPTYSESTTTQVTITTPSVQSTKDATSATTSISTRKTQPHTFSTSTISEVKRSYTLIAVGVSIAVILLVAVVLAVVIWRRGMLRTCFRNVVIGKTIHLPTAEVSVDVDNHQRIEYVNTASDDMQRNTGDTRDAQTYEKLNMTSSSDNYLSIQEIDADRHFYQNT